MGKRSRLTFASGTGSWLWLCVISNTLTSHLARSSLWSWSSALAQGGTAVSRLLDALVVTAPRFRAGFAIRSVRALAMSASWSPRSRHSLRRFDLPEPCHHRRRAIWWVSVSACRIWSTISFPALILLAERPIKARRPCRCRRRGRLRARSACPTELETFDRASVLIPNSSFISDKVKNWTYPTIFVASPSCSALRTAAIRGRSRMFSWRLPVTIRRCLRRRSLRSRSMNGGCQSAFYPLRIHRRHRSGKFQRFGDGGHRDFRPSGHRYPQRAGGNRSAGWTGCAR